MKPVFCYKGLSGQLFVLGIRPLDLIILALAGFFLYAATNSLIAGGILLLAGYFIARKIRFRRDGAFSQTLHFVSTPSLLPVPHRLELKK
jgi:hypothetical protein